MVLADEPYHASSDRGMSLPVWQDWIVDLLIKKHDEGCSDNQLRMMFATEFDRRYGNGKVVQNDNDKASMIRRN